MNKPSSEGFIRCIIIAVNFLHNLVLFIAVKLYRREPRLKQWIELETYKEKIIESVRNDDRDFPRYILTYLSHCFGIPYRWFEQADWWKLIQAFYTCISKSPHVELPLTRPSGEKSKDEDWSYDGRMWHVYSHMLAKAYGWTLEYISLLQVGEALAKIQEILVDEQLEREFYYGLSEVAYAYDKSTKKSKFVPLPRPIWMRPKVEPEKIKKILIPVGMMPMGVVEIGNALPPDLLPKEYEQAGQTQSVPDVGTVPIKP